MSQVVFVVSLNDFDDRQDVEMLIFHIYRLHLYSGINLWDGAAG